jgi:hypothetical protein
MIVDRELYNICKKNAAKSVAHLSLETISKQWESILLKTMTTNNDVQFIEIPKLKTVEAIFL